LSRKLGRSTKNALNWESLATVTGIAIWLIIVISIVDGGHAAGLTKKHGLLQQPERTAACDHRLRRLPQFIP